VNAADTRIFATTPKAMVVWRTPRTLRGNKVARESLAGSCSKSSLMDDDAHQHRANICAKVPNLASLRLFAKFVQNL
jgi:hypothetical protein